MLSSMNPYYIPRFLYEQSPWDTAVTLGSGMRIARHPLYCDLLLGTEEHYRSAGIPGPEEIAGFNLKRLWELWEKDAAGYIFLHARPFRFQALLDTKRWCEKVQWYALAGEVWLDSEGPGQNKALWLKEVFQSTSSSLTMTEQEQELLEKTRTLKVYRGAGSRRHARYGLSWTTDRDKAIWFSRRFTQEAYLAETLVEKRHIAARFLRRGEFEVILRQVPRETVVHALKK